MCCPKMPFIAVFVRYWGREKQVKIVNEVKQLVRERINSGAVEGHDRSPKPVLDKELGQKKQVKIMTEQQVKQEMMGKL